MSDAPAAPTESVDLDGPPAPPEHLSLASEFPPATREQWGTLVAGVLDKSGARGLTPESAAQKLTVTVGGIPIAPIYGADDDVPDAGFPGSAPFVRGRVPQGTLGGWDVRAQFSHPSPAETREQILLDLENGVTSLWLSVGGSGFPLEALGDVLGEVLLDLAPVVLDAGADAIPAGRAFLDVAAARGVDVANLSGNLGLDPLGYAARAGTAVDLSEAAAFAAEFVASSSQTQLRSIVVDALPFHDAGATEAQELGLSIAAGVAYLRALAAAGMSPEAAAGQLEFRYAATDDQFLTIAKLRAARKLWSRVAAACGVPEEQQGQLQHAVTSWPMMTRRDPYVNMLRTTVAAFAAGVGGADSVTVLPFDSALGIPETLGRRVARNTQSLIIDESHIAAVIDPAGGSWYVESLTETLAQAGWDQFQAIEESGGIAQALADGVIAESLARSRSERDHKIDVREDAITGVSEFPQLDEKAVVREPAPELPSGGLPRIRWSERHEAMRERSDRFTAETGRDPAVVLVALESTRAASARLSFAGDLLLPAGITTATVAADADLKEALQANATTVACLCGTDDAYAASAASVADALRQAGATQVLLAGQAKTAPGAKIDTFLFRGCDAVAAQEQLLDELGVKR
ncbi:MAG: Methylmalonyl-CoA mutase small subunit [Mycobacterium sp.]|nr:Methylmalonyl-CoA mutase small subunit [Mycobacterium sp.]